MTFLFVFTYMMNIMKSIDSRRLSQALVHVVIDRSSLFTDHRISGRPLRAKYQAFQKQFESILVTNAPTDLNASSSSKWWSSMHGVDTL